MSKSILQTEKECYVTGSVVNLHRHHVYGGPRRKASEKYGCWIYLRDDYHNMSNHGIHFDRELDLRVKRECQIAFEKLHGHQKFMKVFGKNYI